MPLPRRKRDSRSQVFSASEKLKTSPLELGMPETSLTFHRHSRRGDAARSMAIEWGIFLIKDPRDRGARLNFDKFAWNGNIVGMISKTARVSISRDA